MADERDSCWHQENLRGQGEEDEEGIVLNFEFQPRPVCSRHCVLKSCKENSVGLCFNFELGANG